MPVIKQTNNVESQTSPIKETSSQVSGSSTELFLESQTGSTLIQSLNDSKEPQSEIQRHEMNITANDIGDDNFFRPKITNLQIEEQLVRDVLTNELFMPLSYTIVLKRTKEMLYVPLYFENGLTIDALVGLGAYVSAIAQTELDRIKRQAPANIFKIDDSPNFQIQVANGRFEKPISTTTLKFDIGDNIFAEHFVVMKNLTGPFIGLHLMRHNSVVIDTTHGLIHLPHLTMQAKKAAIEPSAEPQSVLVQDNTTVPPMTTKTVTAFVDLSSEWHKTGTVTPVGKFTETASLLISQSISTINDKKTAVRMTYTTESPYSIKKKTQIAEFSGVILEQSKFIRPVDTIREDVQTTPIEVTTSSSDVADEEQFLFTQRDEKNETEEQTLEREEQSRIRATERVAHEEPSSMKPSIKEFTKIDGNTMSYSID